MEILQSREDVMTNKIGKFRQALPQFLAVSVKNTLLFVYGMTLGFPTIVIPAIQGGEGREPSDIVLSREEISWFSSINLICVPVGCLFSGIFSQPIGKRKAMQIINFPILASWLLFHFATNTMHLYIGLCLFGLSGGLMEAPVLTYVAEVTEPTYRGILAASGSACVILGVFVQFILGSILDWRTVAAVCTVFPILSFLTLFLVPESPTWLIRKNRIDEAEKALQWLRGWVPHYQIEKEFNYLYEHLKNYEKQAALKSKTNENIRMFIKKSFWRPFALIIFCFFVGHFSGKTSLQTYAVQIFHTLKAPLDKYYATILLGLAEVIGTVLCVILVHFTGKRPLVFASTIGCGFCFFATASYAHFFLDIVPGFAVNNVVANASVIVPKSSVITTKNVTEIFENEANFLNKTNASLLRLHDENETTTVMFMNYSDSTFQQEEYENFITEGYMNEITENYSNETVDEFTKDFFENDTTIQPNSYVMEKISSNDSPTADEAVIPENILVPIPHQEKNKYLWLPLVFLLGSAFFAHLGIRLIPWMLIGEVFPASIRNTASGISGAMGYLFGFLVNKVFLQMVATITLPGTFWFYSSVAFAGTIVLYFILPETEGRTLVDIEIYFSAKNSNQKRLKISRQKSIKIKDDFSITEINSNENSKGFTNKGFENDNKEQNKTTKF